MSTTTEAANDEAGSRDVAKGTGFRLDHSLVEFCMYQGMMMPRYKDPPEVHVPKVMNLSLRDTDIILLTYPKSGTHWVWRALDMLSSGSAAYSGRCPESFFLDLVPTEAIDQISTDARRVLFTHFPSDLLPAQIKDGRVKVVHVYRHPKAVMVSMFFHSQKAGKIPDLTLDMLEATMYDVNAPSKNQFHYFDKLMEYERDNPNVDIFHLAYEDMKEDTVGCVKKLAAHLDVDASDELCTSIAEAVSFSTQKQNEESDETQKEFYRKGEVDDWKNHLTVAKSERMDKILADRAASCQFSRRYCPTVTTDQGHVYRVASSS